MQFVSLKLFKIQRRQDLPIPADLIQLHAAIRGDPRGPCTSDSLLQAPADLCQPAATNPPVPRLSGSADWSTRCQQGVMAATAPAAILQGKCLDLFVSRERAPISKQILLEYWLIYMCQLTFLSYLSCQKSPVLSVWYAMEIKMSAIKFIKYMTFALNSRYDLNSSMTVICLSSCWCHVLRRLTTQRSVRTITCCGAWLIMRSCFWKSRTWGKTLPCRSSGNKLNVSSNPGWFEGSAPEFVWQTSFRIHAYQWFSNCNLQTAIWK